jgi:hypothetical protein
MSNAIDTFGLRAADAILHEVAKYPGNKQASMLKQMTDHLDKAIYPKLNKSNLRTSLAIEMSKYAIKVFVYHAKVFYAISWIRRFGLNKKLAAQHN